MDEVKPNRTPLIIIGSLLVLLIAGVALWYAIQYPRTNGLPLTFDLTTSNDGFYYYASKTDQENDRVTYTIYQLPTVFGEREQKRYEGTYSQGSWIVTESGKPGTILIIEQNEDDSSVVAIDLAAAVADAHTLYTFAATASKERIRSARFIDEGAALAVVTSGDDYAHATHSVLRIVTLADRSVAATYLLSERSPLYAGFAVVAAPADGTHLYLREQGGDAGVVWSSWYVVDRKTGAVRKLEGLPPYRKDAEAPAPLAFDPSGTRMVYADISTVPPATDLETPRGDEFYGCLTYTNDAIDRYRDEGGVLMIQDLRGGPAREVFRNNRSFEKNLCMNKARRITDVLWPEPDRIVFQTIEGVYAYDVPSGEVTPLYIFARTFDPRDERREAIIGMADSLLFFSDGSLGHMGANAELKHIPPERIWPNYFVAR